MARHLITHTYAERERALANGMAPLHASWQHPADSLCDATGVYELEPDHYVACAQLPYRGRTQK